MSSDLQDTFRAEAKLNDMKLIYRVLQENMTKFPDLMECDFFDELQHFLQERAKAEGVGIADEGVWDSWLAQPAGR
ncbi:MAG: hypothetical protein MJE77_17215 [Proteobacteria bacterium]|nr:hypothetical protein [Pseudomonadota bacterium]